MNLTETFIRTSLHRLFYRVFGFRSPICRFLFAKRISFATSFSLVGDRGVASASSPCISILGISTIFELRPLSTVLGSTAGLNRPDSENRGTYLTQVPVVGSAVAFSSSWRCRLLLIDPRFRILQIVLWFVICCWLPACNQVPIAYQPLHHLVLLFLNIYQSLVTGNILSL